MIVAQCILFLLAGYETTSSTLAFTTHFLAKYPHEQQRIRTELQTMVQEHGGVAYHGIKEAKFLEACIMGKKNYLLNSPGRTMIWLSEI